jgi:ubiquinone/menaquinone biosynthesis C-methylase UbiE
MDEKEVGNFWNKNAEVWTELARKGYDRSRNLINTPAFFKMLPNIKNKKGLDIGCGEGYNTRIAAKREAILTAIDISEKFIDYAMETEKKEPLEITYLVASVTDLHFSDNYFDFIIATMSLMDVASTEKALSEAYRVLKPGGFFQFSITHPICSNPGWEWIRDEEGKKTGFIVKDYFTNLNGEIDEWIFNAAPKQLTEKMRKFRIPRFTRTLSEWLNMLIRIGFVLEEFCEPYADDETLEKHPEEYDSRIMPQFLIIRCRK